MTSNGDRTAQRRAFVMEDVEETTKEAGLAKRALDAGDAAEARRRLSRVIDLATEASAALGILHLQDVESTH